MLPIENPRATVAGKPLLARALVLIAVAAASPASAQLGQGHPNPMEVAVIDYTRCVTDHAGVAARAFAAIVDESNRNAPRPPAAAEPPKPGPSASSPRRPMARSGAAEPYAAARAQSRSLRTAALRSAR